MKCLITGGAGFIGSNLAAALVGAGDDVVVLDNLSTGYLTNLESLPDVELVTGDIRDAATVNDVMKSVDVVFHLAASVGNQRSLDDPIQDTQINALGTLNLLEAARHTGVRKFVYSSSAGIFGELKQLPIREDHPLDPDTPYGASKLAGEKLGLAYAKLYGIEFVALRYFNVYGIHQRYDAYGNVIPIFAHRIYSGEPLIVYGDGGQTRDFVNAADVVQANFKASRAAGVWGVFNIGSATSITINRLTELMIEKSASTVTVEHGLPRPGDVRDSLADISAARAAFGFEPAVDLETGLAAYLQWYESAMAAR